MTRSMAIKWLKWIQNMFPEDSEQYKALQLGIDSMEVDEAYQLEFEQTTKNDLGVDAVSRKAVINQIFYSTDNNGDVVLSSALRERIARLPSVTPQEPRCKDCKWWKDSDGEYRRGCGAESQCPINRREVFEGNGYCFLFEPQESEDDK